MTRASCWPRWNWSRAPPARPVPIKPNVMLYVYGMNVPPEVIYIIRHAEKPLKPPSSGVDFEGGQNEHSLLPRGWQRSGALAALFHPDFGPMRAGLRTPTVLVAPSWGHPGKTVAHRSYQTIQGLGEQLGLPVACQFAQGQEQQLASSLVRSYSGVVLVCWEHNHIPVIASSLPVVSGTAIPRKWPDDRYDVIWSFGRLSFLEQSCYFVNMRLHVPRAKIRVQSPVLAVVLLAILVMLSAVLGWLGGLVAWLIVLAALAVFVFCLRARP